MPSSRKGRYGKAIRIEMEDGCLRSRRPERVRRLLSNQEWQILRQDLYLTLYPAVQFKNLMIITLVGLFVLPFLSFVFLLIMDQTDIIEIDGDTEEAFELLLVIATCGCLGFGLTCLLLGSAIRRYWIESSMKVGVAKVVQDFEEGREEVVYEEGAPRTKIGVELSPASQQALRRIFLAWSDVDYHLLVSLDDDSDDDSGEEVSEDYRQL